MFKIIVDLSNSENNKKVEYFSNEVCEITIKYVLWSANQLVDKCEYGQTLDHRGHSSFFFF